MKHVAIVGGGLAGLISAIELSKKGVPCRLFERKQYPFHRVCGEYISNETVPYLKKSGLYPENFLPSSIKKFQLSAVRGQSATMPLDLGGFGISRYAFDNFLYEIARENGVECLANCEVTGITFRDNVFYLETPDRQYESDVVIGTFGKRSKLDVTLQRDFITRRSPYIGVKHHVKTDFPSDLIALHNFPGGYCGVVSVEKGVVNICYLSGREPLQQHGNLEEMEKNVLCLNPFLKELWNNSEFLFDKPIVINEISFETKSPVDQHILMAGDAAGMIAPLCGNGMAMAIHAGKLLSTLVGRYCKNEISREELERSYVNIWRKHFELRLQTGRVVQKLFGNATLSNIAVSALLYSKPLSRMIMKQTHGQIF